LVTEGILVVETLISKVSTNVLGIARSEELASFQNFKVLEQGHGFNLSLVNISDIKGEP
jgi:hypothetical protein